ncbi:hypothetical protein J8982_27925, partial [Klebsiella pneumoniae]|uniref:hypothetical protein n=1 Tax=Klebsiella pneumoniae TaxID=573 RepID=UPI001BA9CCC5
LERWIKGSAILGCVGCLVGHLFMFLVGGKTPDQSVHLNLTTTTFTVMARYNVFSPQGIHRAINLFLSAYRVVQILR